MQDCKGSKTAPSVLVPERALGAPILAHALPALPTQLSGQESIKRAAHVPGSKKGAAGVLQATAAWAPPELSQFQTNSSPPSHLPCHPPFPATMWGATVLCLLLAGVQGALAAPLLPPDPAACAPGTLFEATSQEHSCSESLYHREDAGKGERPGRQECASGPWPPHAAPPAGPRSHPCTCALVPLALLAPRPSSVEPCCRKLSEFYGPNSTLPSRNCFCLESYWTPFVALSGAGPPLLARSRRERWRGPGAAAASGAAPGGLRAHARPAHVAPACPRS